MAIDTASKRFSFMGIGNVSILHNIPAGSVNAAKRATFIHLYEGIALGTPAAIDAEDVYDLINDTFIPLLQATEAMVMGEYKLTKLLKAKIEELELKNINLYSAIRDIRREQLRGRRELNG